ncbi:hypothetical protein PC119_g772 [Phytophthora cactorum]|nr:hypothetical protein PC114_g3067 [Phytophthora cactorum]KAG3041390.1 hypothetical protein PC119_g772 [Phytophthora cactorum]KAG3189161.1 hypothetical protein C6341_g2381 [Phytophthora cactorum]KAG3204933.1 hypothetical protein PC128_g1633 [Phytophthora cactorum]KAG4059062.1 hypothetical protein PC123_g6009 [Phytophthora cactorum]
MVDTIAASHALSAVHSMGQFPFDIVYGGTRAAQA